MEISKYLSDHNIKPSYLRIRIMDYMLTRKNHPTVDMIYEELTNEIPTLSRTSVYNTVNLFFDKGLVQKLGIDDAEARYDADINVHAHFMCDKCGKIKDIEITEALPAFNELSDIEIREIQYYLKGLCEQCK